MKFIIFCIIVYFGSKYGVDLLWKLIFGEGEDK
jgi:hypothetical protein